MAYTYTDNTFRLNYNGSGADEVTINSTGRVIATQSSSNIGLELHATGSGRGSQVKIHNDHGEAYVGTAGDTTGDFIVWQQSTANLLFGTSNIERLSIDSDGSAFFKGGSNGTKGTINIESNDPFIRIYDSDGTANRRKWDIRLIGQSGYEELDFRAVNDANSSFISKMQIEYGGDVNISDGNLRVADGHGIDFSANGNSGGMTSELLDDYEEGTWTPQWGSTSGSFGSITYAHQSGTYTKIGNRVFVDCRLRSNSLAMGTASSHLLVTGLPFTVANSQGAGGGSPSMYGLDLPDGTKNIAIETRQNSTQFYAGLVTRDNASWSNLQANALSTGISIIRVTFSYYTNS